MQHTFMGGCKTMRCYSATFDTSENSPFAHEVVRCNARLHMVLLCGADYGITTGGADHILELWVPPCVCGCPLPHCEEFLTLKVNSYMY